MKLVCIFLFCFIINSTYGGIVGIAFDSTMNELEPIFANWTVFQTRHIVDRNQGSAAKWNAYFAANNTDYGIKSINTYIVNAPNVIAKNFPQGRVPQYIGNSSARNLFWSSTTQHIFVLKLPFPPASMIYDVYDCGQKFYVAGLDMKTRMPVHYQGHSTTQGPTINPNVIAGCLKVTRHDSFCQVDETTNGRHTDCIAVIGLGTLFGLVIVAFIASVIFKKRRGHQAESNAGINEYSPLIDNDGQNVGNQLWSGY